MIIASLKKKTFFYTSLFLTSALSLETFAQIEEIVVTATRREQSLQTVPISISAFNAETLDNAGIREAFDLSIVTPGLVMSSQNGGLTPFIRGIGSQDVSPGQEPSVAMYLDGVYLPVSYGNIFSFNSIERVEVLKGPQGTLFGRNATGGLIHVITKTPAVDQSPELEGSVSYGNYDTATGKLYAASPIGDKFAASIGIVHTNQGEGFGKNVDTGSDVNKTEETLLRAKLLYAPADDTRFILSLNHVDSKRSQGPAKQFLPGAIGLDGMTTYTGNFQDVTGSFDPIINADGFIASLQIDHDFGGISLRSITAYQDMDVVNRFDNDLTVIPIVDVEIDTMAHENFSQEIQIASNGDGRLQWVAGLFYLDGENGFGGDHGLGMYGAAFETGGINIVSGVKTEAAAVFGEVTYALSDRTSLVAGLRYSRETRELFGYMDIVDGYAMKNVLMHIPIAPEEKTFSEPTYRAMLSHAFTESVMVYGSYSRGFKSGNFNNVGPTDPPFKEEILDAFEIGFKSDLLDRRLRLNAATFYYDYSDIQLGVPVGATIVTVNAASAEVMGAEVEGVVVFSDSLELAFGLSVLDSEIEDFSNATCFIPQPTGGSEQVTCDASGNPLPRSPEITFNVAPTLSIPLGYGTLQATAAFYYSDGFAWDFSGSRTEDSYELVNASITWQAPNNRFGVSIFGNNLTDSEYAMFVLPQGTGDSFSAASPRTYGVEFKFSL